VTGTGTKPLFGGGNAYTLVGKMIPCSIEIDSLLNNHTGLFFVPFFEEFFSLGRAAHGKEKILTIPLEVFLFSEAKGIGFSKIEKDFSWDKLPFEKWLGLEFFLLSFYPFLVKVDDFFNLLLAHMKGTTHFQCSIGENANGDGFSFALNDFVWG